MERSSCAVQLELRATPQHEIYLTDSTRQRELQKDITTVHVCMYIRGNSKFAIHMEGTLPLGGLGECH